MLINSARIAIRKVSALTPWTLPAGLADDDDDQHYDLTSESPSMRLKSRASASVTLRAQRWTELQTRPMDDGSPAGAAHDNDLQAFGRAYKVGRRIGAGGFGTVLLAVERATGERVAVKQLSSRDMTMGDIHREVEVLRALDHPNIVRVIDIFWNEDKSHVFLVEELQLGKELFQWVRALGGGRRLRPHLAARLVSELLCGMRHLHERGVIHRDIKPSNLLLSDGTENATLRISDFGLCALLRDGSAREDGGGGEPHCGGATGEPLADEASLAEPERRASACAHPLRLEVVGTPEFMAPEVVLCAEPGAAGYSFPCDVWSAGCVIFALLTGHERGPFSAATVGAPRDRPLSETFAAVLTCNAPLEQVTDYLARDLLWKMLVLKPDLRYTAADALTHPWLLEPEDGAAHAPPPPPPPPPLELAHEPPPRTAAALSPRRKPSRPAAARAAAASRPAEAADSASARAARAADAAAAAAAEAAVRRLSLSGRSRTARLSLLPTSPTGSAGAAAFRRPGSEEAAFFRKAVRHAATTSPQLVRADLAALVPSAASLRSSPLRTEQTAARSRGAAQGFERHERGLSRGSASGVNSARSHGQCVRSRAHVTPAFPC
ncbi:hypothetical protein AB1Y20_020038 [Prymnesium parvum]|uniref:Protein kinase domain-containing protein n=1 Tax=Prymnesium parvum TaxID=97485 RepID=A0AB34JWF0_PRYPA